MCAWSALEFLAGIWTLNILMDSLADLAAGLLSSMIWELCSGDFWLLFSALSSLDVSPSLGFWGEKAVFTMPEEVPGPDW